MRNRICKKGSTAVAAESGSLPFVFSNGETVTVDLGGIVPGFSGLPLIGKVAIAHGISQKGGDSFAGAETVEEAIAALKQVIEDLLAGRWNTARGAGVVRFRVEVEALAALAGINSDEAQEAYDAMDEDEQAALKKQPAFKAKVAAIRAERAAARAKRDAEKAAGVEFDASAFISQ